MFCFCTLLLTFETAMDRVVMPGDQTQTTLLQMTDINDDEDMVTGELVEKYPFLIL